MSLLWEPIQCEFCDAAFDRQDDMQQHLRLHSRRKPYKCDECGAKFSYNSTLEWHKRSHAGELPFKCSECGAQFSQNSMLVWHERKHRIAEASQNSPLFVSVTNMYPQQSVQGLPTIFSLPNLVNTVNGTPVNVVATCSGGTTTTTVAPPPLPIPFPVNTINTSVPAESIIPPVNAEMQHGMVTGKRKVDPEEGTFLCDVCGTVLFHSSDLKAHMLAKHNVGENNPFHILAKQQEASGQFVIRKKIIIEKPYKCDLCGVGFNTEGHLKTHRQKHIVERPYRCEKCGLSFSDQVTLESHERRHQAERPHKCEICGAAFFRGSHLHRHIKRHTGEMI